MDVACIPFKKTGYFSDLICDYIDGKKSLQPFYHRFFKLEDFKGQIEEKATHFPNSHRELLYDALQSQYKGIKVGKKTGDNLKQLKEPITFTVVTGHQLNLFTGPMYFLYKIISTINLCLALKKEYPKYNFVPVYWMATEDHDFDEINYFNVKGKKLQWNIAAKGAVGRLPTSGLQEVYDAFGKEMGNGQHAEAMKNLFQKAYLEHGTLTEATRYLANALFGDYGLVIMDGDHADLKRLLIPFAKKDIIEQLSYQKVTAAATQLQQCSESYGIQVNPREINYFYMLGGIRERLIEKDGRYFVNDTQISFTKESLLEELEQYPERFSPNVISRPLYQEVILPNLCYIGGGGEIAYWLELKSMFEAMKIPFPILMLRNSALMVSAKQAKKLQKMQLSIADLFLERNRLINKKIRAISNIDIDFTPQKKYLEEQFEHLHLLAKETDPSFLGAVKAQEVKQKKGLDKLEKRLLKAQKRKLEDHVIRITELQQQLFPNQSLQERNQNFSELYLEMGPDLIPKLMEALNPLRTDFVILEY